MCTAADYKTADHYFGRNLDLEYSYNETITVTPRNYPFHFRCGTDITSHHAIIGVAFVVDNYPLYYDAVNEKGLGIAGLNFPGNADYKPEEKGLDNIAPFELIPWILSQCSSVSEAETLLSRINITNTNFSDTLPLSPPSLDDSRQKPCNYRRSGKRWRKSLRKSRPCTNQQPRIRHTDVLIKQLHVMFSQTSAEFFLYTPQPRNLQPRNGRTRSPGRPLLPIQIHQSCFHPCKLRLRHN